LRDERDKLKLSTSYLGWANIVRVEERVGMKNRLLVFHIFFIASPLPIGGLDGNMRLAKNYYCKLTS
jgi:hypothetical protein